MTKSATLMVTMLSFATLAWSLPSRGSDLADVVIEKVIRQHAAEVKSGSFRANQEAHRTAARAIRISQPDIASSPTSQTSRAPSGSSISTGAGGASAATASNAVPTTVSAKTPTSPIIVSQVIAAQRQATIVKAPKNPAKK